MSTINEILLNIGEAVAILVWFDWLTLVTLTAFFALGFKRGSTSELINLVFLAIAIFVAWLFYEQLVNVIIASAHQSHFAMAFGVLFAGVIIIKRVLYKLISILSDIKKPCMLNWYFSLLILFAVTAFISCCYFDSIANFGIMKATFINESFRIGVGFFIVFIATSGVALFVANILHISVDTDGDCWLSPLFQKILSALRYVDITLNARNIDNVQNKIWGAVIGIFKGFVLIIVAILVLQNISNISQKHYWIESKNSLKVFQNVVLDISPKLSKYLLFINKN